MKRTIISIGVSFTCGVIVGTLLFSDYDVLANYHNKEVQLQAAIAVENVSGKRVEFLPGTVLYHKKSYEEEDYLFIEVVARDIEEISSHVSDVKEQSIYYLK